jgi:hypothetical protein
VDTPEVGNEFSLVGFSRMFFVYCNSVLSIAQVDSG